MAPKARNMIFALIVAILLPSLKRARDQAKALVCLTHEKQLGTAFEYYHYESKKYLPPFCFIISRCRRSISSGDTSSTWVAIVHLWPNGSISVPDRSP